MAEATDINGETRIGQLNVPVSYQALQIELPKIEKLDKNKLQKILVQTKNINGGFESAPVRINIYALDAQKQFYRNRYWEVPDQFIYTENEFHKWFPYDLYKDENNKQTWKQLQKVYTTTATTKLNEPISLQNQQFVEGNYMIEAIAKDKYGETVKEIQYIELTGATPTNFSQAITISNDKAIYAPSQTATTVATTNLDNVFAIHDQHYMTGKKTATVGTTKNNIVRNYITFSNKQYKNDITITEADRGGINNEICFVKNNRFYNTSNTLNIPWSNKELNIQFNTFRDKTLPGSSEEYSITIKGDSGTKVAAEMLATMYDASLDQILPQSIPTFLQYPTLYISTWDDAQNFNDINGYGYNYYKQTNDYYAKQYDAIGVKIKKTEEPLWWLNPLDYAYGELPKRTVGNVKRSYGGDGRANQKSAAPMEMSEAMANRVPGVQIGDVNKVYDKLDDKELKKLEEIYEKVNTELVNEQKKVSNTPRKNFNETAFFYPDLKTDAEGNIIFKYTIPEALTEWKLLALAHTKDLAIGTATKTVITQKPLMVQPNLPRFVREGDKLNLAVKVVNLSDKEVTGTSQLELINPETNQSVDGWFKNMYANQYFTIAAGQSTVVNFAIEIPFNYNKPVIIRTSAITTKSADSQIPPLGGGGASDAEENIIPVVTNRMLVTETMPINMNANGTKKFVFEKLLNSTKSNSLSHQAITVEYTSNPAWYAVQALPYLMEYPYECAEQTFNRYYANALASKIANSNPKIKAVFDKWATTESKELISNLSKNEELKSALLQETPWVMDAQNETQQKKNIALLFDLNKMAAQLKSTTQKLQEMQSSNGGFTWFKGGSDDRYITQYILTGIGHLSKLGALEYNNEMNAIVNKAIPYLDARMQEDYNELIKIYKTEAKIANNSWGNYQLQYLYMRSFFSDKKIPLQYEKAYLFFITQSEKNWLQQSKYMQAMTALVMQRNNKKASANAIVQSLKENALINEELGMYWKDIVGGYYWHQAPIETMSLMVETFNEVTGNIDDVNALKTWLLKNKQTSNWKTTKATAEACYALLLQGTDFLSNNPSVEVKLGNTNLSFGNNTNSEAGTFYAKKRIEGEKVKPEMGNISVKVTPNTNNTPTTSWGAVYWQYFEDLDKITGAVTPLVLQKKLFKQVQTDKGNKLVEIKENDALQVGDKMIVKISLQVDRDMEYVHMKDMRSSGSEPVNVISQYKWQDGLGYYESTKDASTNFFFSYLRKGTYVFEYPLFISHKGNFSNGVTTIQCMYAPEFTSHSEGVRVNVE